jgi:hypothetical protein
VSLGGGEEITEYLGMNRACKPYRWARESSIFRFVRSFLR